MLTLNFKDTRPLYEQIRDAFRRLIVSGAMAPDEQLPSVRSLASQLAINPNTIQRAYAELESRGLIYSVPGKGSFAAPHSVPDPERKAALCRELRETAAELRYLGVPSPEVHIIIEEAYAE